MERAKPSICSREMPNPARICDEVTMVSARRWRFSLTGFRLLSVVSQKGSAGSVQLKRSQVATTEETRSLIPTLPGHFYVDPAVFLSEQSKIFSKLWFCTARASELKTPGSFQTFEVGGESLIIVRDGDQQDTAFFNVHRQPGV